MNIGPDLEQRLARSRVLVDFPDEDTVFLRRVPTHSRYFSKRHTNLLVKRGTAGMPFLIGVDEDLEYRGEDLLLTRAFAGAPRQKGWRILPLGRPRRELSPAVESALAALGFDGHEPALRGAGHGQTLSTLGRNLSPADEETVGRREAVDAVLSSLFERRPCLMVLRGTPGVGKTNLLHAVARRLRETSPETEVVAVHPGVLFAGQLFESERENTLATLLREASDAGVVLALERADVALAECPHGGFLLSDALDRGARLLGTTLPPFARRIDSPALEGRLRFFEIPAPESGEALEMVGAWRLRIARHHGVEITEDLVEAALKRSEELPGGLPGKAVRLLDAAASRAALARQPSLELQELYLAALSLETFSSVRP